MDSTEYSASAKATGGGGFNHEDQVGAYYLAKMLAGSAPFGDDRGLISEVKFQTHVDGWLLDDLLLTLKSEDGICHCAFSIKSNQQFSATGAAPADFVRDCWKQVLSGGPMDSRRDLLIFAVAGVPAALVDDFNTLRGLAEASGSEPLEDRLSKKGFVDDAKRRLANSFACPNDLASGSPNSADRSVSRILARVVLIDFDFSSIASRQREESIGLCARSLRNPSPQAAAQLWADLCALARDYRPRAGTIDLSRLVAHLRSKHELLHFIFQRGDWEQLGRYTTSQLDVPNRFTLAGQLGMLRLPLRQKLDEAIRGAKVANVSTIAVLLGRSGDGKSVLARQWLAAGSPQVWLDARLFDCPPGQNPTTAAEAVLNVGHPLTELLSSAAGKQPRLVIDGIGRLFDETSLATVASLTGNAAVAGWEVVVTCQSDDWARISALLKAISVQPSLVPVGPLAKAELQDVAVAIPWLRPLIARPDLERVLACPKYLAVIVGAHARASSDFGQWTGESHVVEWCWHQIVEGTPRRTARSAAAKQLALRQADAMRDSVAESELNAAHFATIDELIRDHVCRKVGERLIFDHDLLGDWARQRILLEQSNVLTFLKAGNRGKSPHWLRSLRLWSLAILEQQRDLAKWISTVRELAAGGEVSASDRVLEAVALCSGAIECLERVWLKLLADNGALLRRLLQRFLHAATIADPRATTLYAALSKQPRQEVEAWAAAQWRIPLAANWPALLTVLSRHAVDAAQLAPGEMSRVARLWLASQTPDQLFRKEAAGIALASARHVNRVLEDRSFHTSSGKLIEWGLCHDAEADAYTAVLTAAPAAPEAVIDFALQACGRRENPETRNEDEPGVVYAPPWPDGPSRVVIDAFRNAFLRADVFLVVAAVAPSAAREILLAVLIDPPELMEHPQAVALGCAHEPTLSIVSVHDWWPPLYARGPFWAFLHASPSIAIDTIIRLVNFATVRWVDQETRYVHHLHGARDLPRPVNVLVMREQPPAHWLGDSRVYGWYLGDARAPAPVGCALMALEQWLYSRLDKGENITTELDQIRDGSRSVAFAGVLCALGRYKPDLLSGPLRFLIGVPEFLRWDIATTLGFDNAVANGWGLGPVREPHLAKQAADWYAMPHRKRNLFQMVEFLFLNDQTTREYQTERLVEWRKQLDGDLGPDQIEAIHICLRSFDISRWKAIGLPDGRKAWQYQQTPEEASENDQAGKEVDATLRLMMFPHRCRKLLDASTLMSDEELGRFWVDLQAIGEQISDSSINANSTDSRGDLSIEQRLEGEPADLLRRRVFDSVMGGIAVLLLRNPSFLDADRSRKVWVLRQLRRIPRLSVPPSDFDRFHPDETSDDRWECFFAEIVVIFLCRKPNSVIWRLWAAMITTGFHYSPVRHLFGEAFRVRARIGGAFQELCYFLLRWSAVRWHAEHARSGWPINIDVQSERDRVVDDYLRGRLVGPLPSLDDIAASPRELPGRPAPPESFRRGLDLHFIAAALHTVMRPSEALNEDERTQWLFFWSELLHWRLKPMLNCAQVEQKRPEVQDRWPRNRQPYKSDSWLLKQAADVVLEPRLTQQHKIFWQPILDLVPLFESWTQDFLTGLFVGVLSAEPYPHAFPDTWKSMLDHASTSACWKKASAETWVHLLGMDHIFHRYWEAQYAPLLRVAQPYLQQFAETKMKSGWILQRLCSLLKTAGAEGIRLSFLPYIANAVKGHSGMLRDKDDGAALARFVDFCLQNHQAAISADSGLHATIAQIIGTLVDLQEPLAYELQDRLGRR